MLSLTQVFPIGSLSQGQISQNSYCESLESLTVSVKEGDGNPEERPQNLIALKSLFIYGRPNLLSSPSGGLPAPNNTSLSIEFCPKLKSLPKRMRSLLQSLKCPEMDLCPDGGLPSSLKSLEFSDSYNLVANAVNLHRQSPSGLTKAHPPEGVLPGTLTGLYIHNSHRLKTLNTKGLEHLNSPRQLDIYRYTKLETITEEGNMHPSLTELNINGSPLLELHIRRNVGK